MGGTFSWCTRRRWLIQTVIVVIIRFIWRSGQIPTLRGVRILGERKGVDDSFQGIHKPMASIKIKPRFSHIQCCRFHDFVNVGGSQVWVGLFQQGSNGGGIRSSRRCTEKVKGRSIRCNISKLSKKAIGNTIGRHKARL